MLQIRFNCSRMTQIRSVIIVSVRLIRTDVKFDRNLEAPDVFPPYLLPFFFLHFRVYPLHLRRLRTYALARAAIG